MKIGNRGRETRHPNELRIQNTGNLGDMVLLDILAPVA